MTWKESEQAYPLPHGWVWTTVGDIYDVVGGGTPSTKVPEFWQGDIPWITSADIYDLKTICPRKHITPSAISGSATNLVPSGSIIVVTRVGLGKLALTDRPICFSQDAQALVNTSGHLYPDYVLYYLSQAVQIFKYRNRGTTIAGVTKTQLTSLPVALPPKAEQKRIVDEIETQFTRLDKVVESLERLQHNLSRYRASVLKAACDGRLVPQDPNDEPAEQLLQRILAERRWRWEEAEWQKLVEKAKKKAAQARRKATGLPARISDLKDEEWQDLPQDDYAPYLSQNDRWKRKYQEPERPDTAGLPELPDGWMWVRVDQLGEVRLGRQRSPKHHQGPHMRPYLRAANATWEGVDLADVMEMNFDPDVFETYRLRKGDILLAEASGSASEVGKPFIWNEEIPDCCFQNTLIRVRLSTLPPDFLYIHFRKDARTARFGTIARGVGIHHLGAERLAEMPVALPPLNEQYRIVEEVERRLSVIDAVEAALTANLKRAERLRQAILQKAFRGELVPQDPTDEPASALLRRIKQARLA